jgi:hypothetical protein
MAKEMNMPKQNWCPVCGADLDARGLCPHYPHKIKEPQKTTRTNLDEKIRTSSDDPRIKALRSSKISWWTNTPLAVALHQEIPRYWYHVGRGSKAEGIPAYKIREIEAADTFGLDYFKYKYVWLSPTPRYGPDAFIIDMTKLDNANLRFTGQTEGNLLHKGDIPPKAIVGEHGKPYN